MTVMGSRLNHLAILGCLLFLLVYVDCRANQEHSPNDRSRHQRSHNLHRPPYEGYDWYKHYERDSDPGKDPNYAKARAGNEKTLGDSPPKDLKETRKTHLSQKEKDELQDWTSSEEKKGHGHNSQKIVSNAKKIVSVIKAVKEKGYITEAERSQLTPELKPAALKIYRKFKDKIKDNPDFYHALEVVLHEIMKTSKGLASKHRRSRHHKHKPEPNL
ncbi:uncharacterized protein LOC108139067 [Drosophila elegans]|uniref:uncharacterized protein LOC108139067 n=1 Tax=Drosophila elegans TaxID=30023 RepID=UPI0007E7B4D2|nr:uncharacterized protein LOC108139067 [Drosophila elegans]